MCFDKSLRRCLDSSRNPNRTKEGHLEKTHVYIVGAGFSKYAGLPLQADFTAALLEPRKDKSYVLLPLVDHLGKFVNRVFDHKETANAKFWPELEDVFTNIDLAANTGHHLGSAYSPSKLRTVRRVLLARIVCMLDERFHQAEEDKGPEWTKMTSFFQSLDIRNSGFISMNWDTVIERQLRDLRKLKNIDYGCGAVAGRFPSKGNVIATYNALDSDSQIPVVKMHGSVNWLYCDNCRQLYWFSTEDAVAVAKQLISPTEAKGLGLGRDSEFAKWCCKNCRNVPLTTRLATFSFLKALDFPMFDQSWLSAEKLLRGADKWIFIGYSLPAADYEFKHLLKRVQLSRKAPPQFVVITGGEPRNTELTFRNYQGFFGRGIRKPENFFAEGLTNGAIAAAQAVVE
jgi:hypothetical protein